MANIACYSCQFCYYLIS